MKVAPGALNQQVSRQLYRKPSYQRDWERDPGQKNERPVRFARDEEHVKRLRKEMGRREVEIRIAPEQFGA